ncbi:MAG: histidine kinase [Bacteroidia bacterium]|nr:histidine kinase [Bacteroidia bacterium]
MKKQIVSLLLVFLFKTYNGFSQNCECPSLKDIQLKTEILLKEAKTDSALLLLNKTDFNNSPNCLAVKFKLYGKLNYKLKNIDEAQQFFKKEQGLLKENKCSEQTIAENYQSLGMVYFFSDQLDSASYFFMKALEIAENIKDEKFMQEAYTNLARTFGKEKQFDKAVYYIKKAIGINKRTNNLFSLAKNYAVLGTAYTSLFNKNQRSTNYLDSVSGALDQGIYFAKLSGNKDALYSCYSNKAGLADHYKNYNLAYNYLDSIIISANPVTDIAPLNIAYFKKAFILFHQNNLVSASQFADSSLKYGVLGQTWSSVGDVYGLIYQINFKKGDYKAALAAHEKLFQLKDSLHSVEKNEKINELEQRYNKAQNEKTIKELGQEKEILNQKEEISKLQINALVIGILFLALLIFVIVFFYRQSVLKNKFKTLEIEQRLNRARINPHFFFNALASLQALSLEGRRSEEISEYIHRFSKIMRESLESTFNELNTIENEIEFLTHYLELQKLRSDNKFNYQFIIDETIETDILLLPGMILQPFIENSIEHGFSTIENGGKINIEFSLADNNLKIVITDNGSGFKESEKHKGYPSRATQIINDRLYLLNKKYKTNAIFELTNLFDKGTKVVILLPVIPKD